MSNPNFNGRFGSTRNRTFKSKRNLFRNNKPGNNNNNNNRRSNNNNPNYRNNNYNNRNNRNMNDYDLRKITNRDSIREEFWRKPAEEFDIVTPFFLDNKIQDNYINSIYIKNTISNTKIKNHIKNEYTEIDTEWGTIDKKIYNNLKHREQKRYLDNLLTEKIRILKLRKPLIPIKNKNDCPFDLLNLIKNFSIAFDHYDKATKIAIHNSDKIQKKTFRIILNSSTSSYIKNTEGYTTLTNLALINNKDSYGTVATQSDPSTLVIENSKFVKITADELNIPCKKAIGLDINGTSLNIPVESKIINKYINQKYLCEYTYFSECMNLLLNLPRIWREKILEFCIRFNFTMSPLFLRAIHWTSSLRKNSLKGYYTSLGRLMKFYNFKSITDCLAAIESSRIKDIEIILFLNEMGLAGYAMNTILNTRSALLHFYKLNDRKFKKIEKMNLTIKSLTKLVGKPTDGSIALPDILLRKFIEYIKEKEETEKDFWKLIKWNAIFMLRPEEGIVLLKQNVKSLNAHINKINCVQIAVVAAKNLYETEKARLVTLPERKKEGNKFWCPWELIKEMNFKNTKENSNPETLFVKANGDPWSYNYANNKFALHWKKFCKTLPNSNEYKNLKFTLHGLRASMFGILFDLGYSTVQIQNIARHKLIQSTLYYLKKNKHCYIIPQFINKLDMQLKDLENLILSNSPQDDLGSLEENGLLYNNNNPIINYNSPEKLADKKLMQKNQNTKKSTKFKEKMDFKKVPKTKLKFSNKIEINKISNKIKKKTKLKSKIKSKNKKKKTNKIDKPKKEKITRSLINTMINNNDNPIKTSKKTRKTILNKEIKNYESESTDTLLKRNIKRKLIKKFRPKVTNKKSKKRKVIKKFRPKITNKKSKIIEKIKNVKRLKPIIKEITHLTVKDIRKKIKDTYTTDSDIEIMKKRNNK